MTYIGIDNGVTGGVAIISDSGVIVYPMPVKKVLSYTKKKQWIHRIDRAKLSEFLNPYKDCYCLIERPMINPMRFKASVSAIRSLEAVECALEDSKIPYEYIDSREWQRVLLPKGLKGAELKDGALSVAKRLFPTIEIPKSLADCLLIAEFCKRKYRR